MRGGFEDFDDSSRPTTAAGAPIQQRLPATSLITYGKHLTLVMLIIIKTRVISKYLFLFENACMVIFGCPITLERRIVIANLVQASDTDEWENVTLCAGNIVVTKIRI